ncbi:MAG: spermidine/putrescine ABC transporter substrate-binding protein, partial [Clostridia bacterium]|nr:spermidine/putrescine ABC transporter substrate-binding protein [Clostridia bacterium]
YMWGTVGIFYNKKMVDAADIEKMSWDILWDAKYSGKILMFDNPRDSFAIALKKLGYSMNTTNKDEITAAYNELVKQKPLVQGYVMDQIFNKMANNEAALAPYYAGDYMMMSADNEDVGFFIPKEGTNRFVDAMCIPAGSKHKDEAEQFINYMTEAEISAANAEYIGYATPQTEAKKLLDPEIANNPIYYPSDEVLANTELFVALPTETYALMENLWIKLKAN